MLPCSSGFRTRFVPGDSRRLLLRSAKVRNVHVPRLPPGKKDGGAGAPEAKQILSGTPKNKETQTLRTRPGGDEEAASRSREGTRVPIAVHRFLIPEGQIYP